MRFLRDTFLAFFLGLVVCSTGAQAISIDFRDIFGSGSAEVERASYNAGSLFPSWGDGGVTGVLGSTSNSVNSGEGRILLYYLPRAANILLLLTAPFVFVMFVFAGLRFIYAGSNDESLEQSKKFFLFGVIGLIVITLSYSFIKVLYYIMLP